VQSHRPADPADPRQYEATQRPVAGGGAMHELELYLTVTHCTGLEPALYRYDPLDHALEWIAAPSADTQALLTGAMAAAGLEISPDVLITLAARFGRMAWKYEGMAYAAILKHVGVLYQQFYLMATALGLAPCALGAGDSDRFAAAAGTHYYEETSVGEFVLSGTPV
jgi:SagB-type dehydrogenase family enzyme